MNLLKKLALLAVILILASLPAYAVEPLTDNFDRFTTDTNRTAGYPKDSAEQAESTVFGYSSGYGSYGYSWIKPGAGPDGSAALVLGGTSSDVSLNTVALDTTGTMMHEFSYDIMFNKLSEIYLGSSNRVSNANPLFKLTADGKVQTTSDGSTYTDAGTYQAGEWYKVVVTITGAKRSGYFIDSQGNAVYSYQENSTFANAASRITPLFLGWAVAGTTTGTIDNAMIVSYDPTVDPPSLINSSVEADEDDVQRNKKLSFVFDQEISEDSVVSLTREDGEEITEVTGITTERTLYNTLVLSYNGLLDRKTTYVLSFEGVSNGIHTCTDEISFTTEDLHIWNDVEVSSAVTNEDDADLTDITFTIGDKYGYPTFSGSVMAAVYKDGKMVAIDMKPLTNASIRTVTDEPKPLTVSFNNLGTALADYSKIGIILVDVENGPIPLAGGMLEN